MFTRKLLFIFFVLSGVMGCKVNDVCDNVICGTGEVCINGTCQDTTYVLTCGQHQHPENNICVCDSGWTGPNCDVPISTFAGTYHVTGQASTLVGGTTYPPVYIDDTIEITVIKDTLIIYDYHLNYNNTIADTSVYYAFGWGPGSNYCLTTFHRIPDDSVFYTSRTGGLGAGTTTTLRGKKL